MEAIDTFTLAKHNGPYESWPLDTEVFRDGISTGRTLPGFVLDAQYRHGDFYLFVTSWDCPYEEALEIILTDANLRVLKHKTLGAMYRSIWLDSCEVTSNNQILLHCDGGLTVIVTLQSGHLRVKKIVADSTLKAAPSDTAERACQPFKTPWWKFWQY